MKPASPLPFRVTLAVLLVASLGWGAWVYRESQPAPLVHGSAYTYYNANVATEQGTPVIARATDGAGYVSWAKLSAEQKRIFAPLEKRWDYLGNYQRRALVETARRYPEMTLEQQQRFQSRLVEWTKLTRKERTELRRNYKEYARLPAEKQAEYGKAWYASQDAQEGQLIPVGAPEE